MTCCGADTLKRIRVSVWARVFAVGMWSRHRRASGLWRASGIVESWLWSCGACTRTHLGLGFFFFALEPTPCTREHGHARTTLTYTHTPENKKTAISHTAVGSAKVFTTTPLSWSAELSFELHKVISRGHNSWSDWCGSGARCCYESPHFFFFFFCQRSRFSFGLEEVETWGVGGSAGGERSPLLPPSVRKKSMFTC